MTKPRATARGWADDGDPAPEPGQPGGRVAAGGLQRVVVQALATVEADASDVARVLDCTRQNASNILNGTSWLTLEAVATLAMAWPEVRQEFSVAVADLPPEWVKDALAAWEDGERPPPTISAGDLVFAALPRVVSVALDGFAEEPHLVNLATVIDACLRQLVAVAGSRCINAIDVGGIDAEVGGVQVRIDVLIAARHRPGAAAEWREARHEVLTQLATAEPPPSGRCLLLVVGPTAWFAPDQGGPDPRWIGADSGHQIKPELRPSDPDELSPLLLDREVQVVAGATLRGPYAAVLLEAVKV